MHFIVLFLQKWRLSVGWNSWTLSHKKTFWIQCVSTVSVSSQGHTSAYYEKHSSVRNKISIQYLACALWSVSITLWKNICQLIFTVGQTGRLNIWKLSTNFYLQQLYFVIKWIHTSLQWLIFTTEVDYLENNIPETFVDCFVEKSSLTPDILQSEVHTHIHCILHLCIKNKFFFSKNFNGSK